MPPVKKSEAERAVIYPEVLASICDGENAITAEKAKGLLGWETEGQYLERQSAGKKLTEKDKERLVATFKPLFKDEEGNKVRCWNNSRNRPYGDSWARQLAQDILNRNWAGPTTMPGETVNGETIVISRTGQVESGQHRLIGLVLAYQIWLKQKSYWESKWPTEPIIETIMVYGVSESSKVLQTLDNVKPRTLDDVFYTSELFNDLDSPEKKECSRMLAKAITLLWRRTGAGKNPLSHSHYQTHSESKEFVDKHPRILKALVHIFKANNERAISGLRLSPGQSAGLLYLMGCSSSDGDAYRNMEVRDESLLDWGNWKKACDFWTDLVKDKLPAVRTALGLLVDEDTQTGGRLTEKFAILAKAWGTYLELADVSTMTTEDLQLEYHTNDKGIMKLINCPDFAGIDTGEPHSDTTQDPTPEELEQRKAEARKAKADEIAAKVAARKKDGTYTAPREVTPPPKKVMDAAGKPPAPKILKTTASAK